MVPSPDVAVGFTTVPGGAERPALASAIHDVVPDVRVAVKFHIVER